MIWVSPYVGYPDCISVDQGPQFQSDEWKNLLLESGIKLQPSSVESHNALGVGERHHFFLRRIYNKVKTDTPRLSGRQALSLSIKAINDTARPNGLVPTLLVLGVMPRLPIRPHNLPEQVLRMKAIKEARDEAVKLVAQTRLATAVASNAPAAASKDIKIGEEALMFREKPGAKWSGLFMVANIGGKMLTLDSGDRTWMASIDKVKRYQERASEPSNIGASEDAAREEKDCSQQLEEIIGPNDDVPSDSNPISIDEFVVMIISQDDP